VIGQQRASRISGDPRVPEGVWDRVDTWDKGENGTIAVTSSNKVQVHVLGQEIGHRHVTRESHLVPERVENVCPDLTSSIRHTCQTCLRLACLDQALAQPP
jgi:hypothetical protein